MKSYEIMYIVKPYEDEKFEAVVERFNTLITNNGGIIEKIDRWGRKRLAYEIQNLKEGLYVLVTFLAESKCVHELDRVMKISTDEILRHMIIRKGE